MGSERGPLRRAPWLVLYWDQGRFIVHNFATGLRVAADPVAARVLDLFSNWRSADGVARQLPEFSRASIYRQVAALERRSLLIRPGSGAGVFHEGWTSWNPAAGFFHLSTKDVRYRDEGKIEPSIAATARRATVMPAAVKRYRGARRYALPRLARTGEYEAVLRSRRTWRRFSRRPVRLGDLAALLELTFGVQKWLNIAGVGRVPLKTSPSGGARHALEAYVWVRNVGGLKGGLFHYAMDCHHLELLRDDLRDKPVTRYLPTQPWFNGAAAVVFITAIFPRVQWRYRFARAYRVVLAEAGHVGQTFCLTATWLGLAPFCTMALADSAIEQELGIDGISESIIYAVGVGSRPGDRDTFAGLPRTGALPWHVVPVDTASRARRRAQ